MASRLPQADLDAIKELRKWRSRLAETEGGPTSFDIPERWFDPTHYRCTAGHVSTFTLKSEAVGADLCLAGSCRKPVIITFPEDRDGPPPDENEFRQLVKLVPERAA